MLCLAVRAAAKSSCGKASTQGLWAGSGPAMEREEAAEAESIESILSAQQRLLDLVRSQQETLCAPLPTPGCAAGYRMFAVWSPTWACQAPAAIQPCLLLSRLAEPA